MKIKKLIVKTQRSIASSSKEREILQHWTAWHQKRNADCHDMIWYLYMYKLFSENGIVDTYDIYSNLMMIWERMG